MMCLGKQKMLIPVSKVISHGIVRIGSHRLITEESEGAREVPQSTPSAQKIGFPIYLAQMLI